MATGSSCGRFCCLLRLTATSDCRLNHILNGLRDGIEPEMIYRWAGWLRRLTPPFLGLVSLPKWMAGRGTPINPTKSALSGSRRASFWADCSVAAERQLKRWRQRTASNPPGADIWTIIRSIPPRNSAKKKPLSAKHWILPWAPPRTANVRARPRCGANEGRFSFLAARRRCVRGGDRLGSGGDRLDLAPGVGGAIWTCCRWWWI